MFKLYVIDRKTKKEEEEKIFGKRALDLFYGRGFLAKFVSTFILPFYARLSFFSAFYGFLQKRKRSARKIAPFIKAFEVDASEFQKSIEDFSSFNDFFIRKLKKEFRPIDSGKEVVSLPADGRYLVFPDLSQSDGFYVKGKKFSLETFLQNSDLAKRYETGAMVIARLCPTDYHRFHFPFDCIPSKSRLINGPLYSVNPIALKKNIQIFSQNKRVLTSLDSEVFGKVMMIEVGATHVGSIHQTFIPDIKVLKGDEKGYFSFGGSSIVLLFEPNQITFDEDLVEKSERKIETKANYGTSLGKK